MQCNSLDSLPPSYDSVATGMRQFTDTEMLDWVELQTSGESWVARQSTTGRGFRLHNTARGEISKMAARSAREAISHAMNKELNALSKLYE